MPDTNMDEINFLAQEVPEEFLREDLAAEMMWCALRDSGWSPVVEELQPANDNYNYAEDLPL